MNDLSKLLILAACGSFMGAATGAHAATIPARSVTLLGNLLDSGPTGDALTVTFGEVNGRATPSYRVVGTASDDNGYGPNGGYFIPKTSKLGTESAYRDAFGFHLSSPATVTYTADPVSGAFSNTSVELLKHISTGMGHGTVTPILGTTVGDTLSFANLGSSAYTLVFKGDVSLKSPTAVLGGTVSAVPLPGSLVMFGSALVGLIGFGTRRRIMA